jgi:hypothetical protein
MHRRTRASVLGPIPALAVVIALIVSAGGPIAAAPPSAAALTPVYPGTKWATRTPSQAGMNSTRLRAFRDYVGGRGCVVRYGYMVYSWGNQSLRADVASACKPWISHFLFEAIEQGRIGNVEDLVHTFEPRLDTLNASLGYKDQSIRWRDLACQTSCYGVTEPPGSAFDYSDWNMALFFDTLFLRVYGSTWSRVDTEVLRPLLTNALQCQDQPTLMAFGINDRPGRVGVSVRDFARFGLLYLRGGKWKTQQIISAAHATMAVTSAPAGTFARTLGQPAEMIFDQRSIGGDNNQTDHFGSYSYAWWTNGIDRDGLRHWSHAPTDTYGAFGHGGIRAMIVIPSLDLVVSWNDSQIWDREMENESLRLLIAAVTS